jgi:hypothetical protein
MARLAMAGCEIVAADPWVSVQNLSLAGSVAPVSDATTPRSGLNAWKCDAGAGNGTSFVQGPFTPTLNTFYFRAYVRFANLPGSTVKIMNEADGTHTLSARLTAGGKLGLYNDATGVQIGSDSAATIVTGSYYRVELSVTIGAGNVVTAGELQLDGVSVASASGLSFTISSHQFNAGWVDSPGANNVMFVDDLALNDSTGAANNSWPGAGNVILMSPISDNARGAWTAGLGGITNLWDAVDNTPPVGVAEGSATNTSQIKNRTTTNPTSCDLNLDTYTNAGIGASDTVNAIQVWDADGEDPATGTKTGACSMVSNPAIAEPTAFNFGDDVGTQGTFLGNWKWHSTAIAQAPTVTLGTAPVIRMRCISGATGSRSASCCFLGAYVDYTPAPAVASLLSAPFRQASNLYRR